MAVRILAATTDPAVIQDTLADMTDGGTYVIAVEVFDHPGAAWVPDGIRYGGDPGPTVLGVWVLGPEAEVHAYLTERGFQKYEEQYAAGYEED